MLVSNIVIIVFVMISILLLNPLVAGFAMLALGACYVFIYAATRDRLLRNGRNESRHFAARSQVVNETFGAIKEITVLNARSLFVQRLRSSAEPWRRSS